MTEYYHWTDEETYKQIMRKENTIQAIFTWIFDLAPHELVPGSGGRDEYGEGVYFTDCGPDLARSTIAGRCWGHSSSTDKVECYFLVDFHGNAKIEYERAHVWKLSPKTTATQFLVDHGYHPEFESDNDDHDEDDEDDEDDYDYPSCRKCGDADDVSDPGGDYYWCSNCEHDIDSDGDCMTSDCSTCDGDQSTCPWCGDEGFLVTQNDDYDGQRIYCCCSVYFDEDGDLWPADNPMGEGLCRCCGDNQHADDCGKELCGSCCEGYCGEERHD